MVAIRNLTLPLALGAGVVFGQDRSIPPQFRSGIDLVHVEVTVLDSERRPVLGLSPADFTVLESGQRRSLSAFEEVRIQQSKGLAAQPDVAANSLGPDRRLVVFLLDNSIEGLWPIKQSKEIAHEFVDQLAPTDLAAVVFTTGSTDGQVFTSDPERLHAAIDRLRPRVSPAGPALLRTLANVVEILAEAPERRRMVVAIVAGLALDVEQLSLPTVIGTPTGPKSEVSQQYHLLQSIFNLARRTNVNVYAVDPYGLYASPGGADARRLQREFLQALAANTGARAIVNTNQFDAGIAAVMRENSSYYLLGFESSAAQTERRLEIRVNRQAITVRAQSVVRSIATRHQTASVEASFERLLPHDGIPLRLWTAAVPREGTRASPVLIVVRATSDGDRRSDFVAQVNAYDLNGRRQASVERRAGSDGVVTEILMQADLRPGRYQLRAVVSEAGSDRLGSVYGDVEVPDFSKEVLWVSPIAIGVRDSPHAVGMPGMGREPATARREFRQEEYVLASLHVAARDWKEVAPVSFKMRVFDSAGKEAISSVGSIAPAPSSRIARHTEQIKLRDLVPGDYTIRFEINGRASGARRVVPVNIRK